MGRDTRWAFPLLVLCCFECALKGLGDEARKKLLVLCCFESKHRQQLGENRREALLVLCCFE